MKPEIYFAEKLISGGTTKENVSIVVEGDRIIDIVKKKLPSKTSGIITPAFIDAHSHIALHRAGEPGIEEEVNDKSDSILPLLDPLDSAYFDDPALKESVDFGVLYSCIVPGSANLIGGRSRIIRNFAQDRSTALFADHGFKAALGFNIRKPDWKGVRANTRMGAYRILEQKLESIIAKREKSSLNNAKKQAELADKAAAGKLSEEAYERDAAFLETEQTLEWTSEEKALLSIAEGKKPLKVHVHKADDVMYLIDLCRRFPLQVSAEHLMDVDREDIFRALRTENIPAVYGPLGCHPYKTELRHATWKNASAIMKSGMTFGLMTDHPVTLSQTLRESLKYFL
ncbi:MAG: amidohydrolase, partial [Fibrobacteres bacterium]|nr:amidohydrolase [Fibrobacterota bacterium]